MHQTATTTRQRARGTVESNAGRPRFAHADVEGSRVTLRGERGALFIDFDPELADVRVEVLPEVDLMSGPRDLQRILFSLHGPVRTGSVRLVMSGAAHG